MTNKPIDRPATAAGPAPVRCAQYLRMSTHSQRDSLESQAAAIGAYAKAHGLEVVRTYADPGRTGLNARRPGL